MATETFFQTFCRALFYGIFGIGAIFLLLGGGWLFLDSVHDNEPLTLLVAILITLFGALTLYLVVKVSSADTPKTNTPA